MNGLFVAKAFIEKKDGRTTIHIGNLRIDLVEEDDEAGPLGWEDGQDPGVVFWENEYVKADKAGIEFGGGPEKAHVEMSKRDVASVRELLEGGEKVE